MTWARGLVQVGQFWEQAGGNLKSAAEKGRELIEWSDDIVDDIDEPLTSTALATQRVVFKVADSFGVGDEVRAMVYFSRTIQYAAPTVQSLAATPAGVAAATTLGSLGSFGALAGAGLIVGAVALVSWLFGDDDDEEEAAKKRRRRRRELREDLLHLLVRLNLPGFAQDQDSAAKKNEFLASVHPGPVFGDLSEQYAAAAATCRRLADFFRAVGDALDSKQREVFVSLLNLGRWAYALHSYQQLSPSKREYVSELVGNGSMDYGARLEICIRNEHKVLAIFSPPVGQPPPSRWWLLVGVGAGALLVARPAAASSLVRRTYETSARLFALPRPAT